MFFMLRILWSKSAAKHPFLTLPERAFHYILWDDYGKASMIALLLVLKNTEFYRFIPFLKFR